MPCRCISCVGCSNRRRPVQWVRFQWNTVRWGIANRHDVESWTVPVEDGKPTTVADSIDDFLQPLAKLFRIDHLWHRRISRSSALGNLFAHGSKAADVITAWQCTASDFLDA